VSLSRKHFNALAEIVADLTDDRGTVDSVSLALRLAAFCQQENQRFDNYGRA
jgi:hypothetical protein